MNQAPVKTAVDKEILGVHLALISDKVIEKEIIDRINKQDICALIQSKKCMTNTSLCLVILMMTT